MRPDPRPGPRPDLATLREMWRYHMGRAYWQAHPRRTLGIYDLPGHRVLQYSVYGLTNLLLPLGALLLAHDIYDDDKFQALASAANIAQVVNTTLYAFIAVGALMSLVALRLHLTQRRDGDTDRCDPFRCWAMFRAYRWARARGWIHEVEGRLVFDRRIGEEEPTHATERRENHTDTPAYPTDRAPAPAITPDCRRPSIPTPPMPHHRTTDQPRRT